MHWKQELIAAAASLVLALPAFGQAGMSGAAGTPPAPNTDARASTDKGAHPMGSGAVLGMLHRSNQHEISLANLAKERSSNNAVKEYADTIINDHKKADDEVQSFATAHNIDLKQDLHAMQEGHKGDLDAARSREVQSATGEYARPMPSAGTGGSGMAAEHKKAIDDLGKLKGPEFDRQFAKTMADSHRKVIDHLKTVRSNPTTDRDLTQLIDKLLPTLQKHESSAQQLESRLSKAS